MTAVVTPLISAVTVGPSFVKATFTGLSSPGAISVPGLEVGDVITWLGIDSPVDNVAFSTPNFEPIISVDDEIQQIGTSDNNGVSFTIICLRGV